MGFIDESRFSWAWPLRRSPSTEKQALERDADPSWSSRGFEIADAMEMGLARETTTDYMLPLKNASKLFKFEVKRSEDARQFRMYTDGGEFLMYAKVGQDSRRVEFFLYDPRDRGQSGLYDPSRPAFTMTCNDAHTEWRLVKERCCDCNCARKHLPCGCQGETEVARIRQDREEIGDGTGNTMEVLLPPAEGEMRGHQLVTKMPTWNDDLGSLVLDFKGRRVQASAKNFQLVPDDDQNHLVCQHCKISSNTFSLDFRFPVTVVQAFGISLTTTLWT